MIWEVKPMWVEEYEAPIDETGEDKMDEFLDK